MTIAVSQLGTHGASVHPIVERNRRKLRNLRTLLRAPRIPKPPTRQSVDGDDHPVLLALKQASLGYYPDDEIVAWRLYWQKRAMTRIWRVRFVMTLALAYVIGYHWWLWGRPGQVTLESLAQVGFAVALYAVGYYWTYRKEVDWNPKSMMAAELYPAAVGKFAASEFLHDVDGEPMYNVHATALMRRRSKAMPIASYLTLNYLGAGRSEPPTMSIVIQYAPALPRPR